MNTLLVIGGGPAGLSAAIAARLAGVEVLIATDGLGGRYQSSKRIENVLGWPQGCEGKVLAESSVDQARRMGVKFTNARAVNLDTESHYSSHYSSHDRRWFIDASDGDYWTGEAVILAHGMTLTPPLKDFNGSKATREPVVVGGGDAAGQSVLAHAGEGRKVHLVVRRPQLTEMSAYLRERIEQSPLVCVHLGCEVADVSETHLVLSNGETIAPAECAWLIGAAPNNGWTGAALDSKGFILTDPEYRTSLPGVWAVGDCRSGNVKRIAVASGEGFSAGVRAAQWLSSSARAWPTSIESGVAA